MSRSAREEGMQVLLLCEQDKAGSRTGSIVL